MRYRLGVQIGITLAVNLALLSALGLLLFLQQSRTGLESFLYTPARERVRELGRQVEEEFLEAPPEERTASLARIQEGSGLTLSVYQDTGELIAGPDLGMPPEVTREVTRGADRPRGKRRGPPIFVVKESARDRFWIGYHFPLVLEPGSPPVRHTLAVVSPSLLTVPFFLDWRPWAAGLSLAALVTALCWIPLLRRLTRSIHAVQTASADIAQGKFDVSIPVTGSDELADLAGSVRRMAEQLSRLVHGQQRFLADVAHELCAPLSRIQLSTGILEQTSSPAALQRLERDVAHMSALVGDLLSFTKGAVRQPDLVPLDLPALVERVILQENDNGADVGMDIDPGTTVIADEEYLTRALANLVRNAIRYAGADGPIRIAATGNQITVRDCGPGLPEADHDMIFSPFYRPDAERTPETGGAGLGLAIVKSCVEACGGKVYCRNRKPTGLEVVIEMVSPPNQSPRKTLSPESST